MYGPAPSGNISSATIPTICQLKKDFLVEYMMDENLLSRGVILSKINPINHNLHIVKNVYTDLRNYKNPLNVTCEEEVDLLRLILVLQYLSQRVCWTRLQCKYDEHCFWENFPEEQFLKEFDSRSRDLCKIYYI